MKIKICGITNLEDAIVCVESGVDMIGFVFYKNSRRFVDYETAGDIISGLPKNIIKVGVFVDESVSLVNSLSSKIGLNVVQLHGNESPQYVSQVELPVIKAFRVNYYFDWNILCKYSNCEFLIDSFSQKGIGGTGETFSWNLIPDKYKHSIILSGGISIGHLENIYYEIHPVAIDVSSSLEIYPGKKDHTKVRNILKALNNLRRKEC